MKQYYDEHGAHYMRNAIETAEYNINSCIADLRKNVLGGNSLMQAEELAPFTTKEGVKEYFTNYFAKKIGSDKDLLVGEKAYKESLCANAISDTNKCMKKAYEAFAKYSYTYTITNGQFAFDSKEVAGDVLKKNTRNLDDIMSKYIDDLLKLFDLAKEIDTYEKENGLIPYAMKGLYYRNTGDATLTQLCATRKKAESYILDTLSLGRIGKDPAYTMMSNAMKGE